jgi:hypothetical protein
MGETKKKVRPGNITASSTELALLIDFQQEEYELLEDGSTGQCIEKSAGSKKIKVRDALTANTDLEKIASQLQAQCKLIKPSAIGAVKAALQQLVEREAAKSKEPVIASDNESTANIATAAVRPSSRQGSSAAGRLEVEGVHSARGEKGGSAEEWRRKSRDLGAGEACQRQEPKDMSSREHSKGAGESREERRGERSKKESRSKDDNSGSGKGVHRKGDKKSRRDQMSSGLPSLSLAS